MKTYKQMVTDYTTLGLGVVGLDWNAAHRIAVELANEKMREQGWSDWEPAREGEVDRRWLAGTNVVQERLRVARDVV